MPGCGMTHVGSGGGEQGHLSVSSKFTSQSYFLSASPGRAWVPHSAQSQPGKEPGSHMVQGQQ